MRTSSQNSAAPPTTISRRAAASVGPSVGLTLSGSAVMDRQCTRRTGTGKSVALPLIVLPLSVRPAGEETLGALALRLQGLWRDVRPQAQEGLERCQSTRTVAETQVGVDEHPVRVAHVMARDRLLCLLDRFLIPPAPEER